MPGKIQNLMKKSPWDLNTTWVIRGSWVKPGIWSLVLPREELTSLLSSSKGSVLAFLASCFCLHFSNMVSVLTRRHRILGFIEQFEGCLVQFHHEYYQSFSTWRSNLVSTASLMGFNLSPNVFHSTYFTIYFNLTTSPIVFNKWIYSIFFSLLTNILFHNVCVI